MSYVLIDLLQVSRPSNRHSACNFDPDALVDDASCFFLPGEFSGDGIVGAADVLAMLNAYGSSCD